MLFNSDVIRQQQINEPLIAIDIAQHHMQHIFHTTARFVAQLGRGPHAFLEEPHVLSGVFGERHFEFDLISLDHAALSELARAVSTLPRTFSVSRNCTAMSVAAVSKSVGGELRVSGSHADGARCVNWVATVQYRRRRGSRAKGEELGIDGEQGVYRREAGSEDTDRADQIPGKTWSGWEYAIR